MRYAIIGGDRRSALLGGLLLAEGHRVHSFALEKGELPEGIPRDETLRQAVYGADLVVLPVPAEREGLLNTPLSERTLHMEEILETLWPGQLVFGGGFREESLRQAAREELRITDLLRRPDYAFGNAALTAEGALGLLIRESPDSLWGREALICGWGRLGRMLALRLEGLGCEVTVAARSPSDRAAARALGLGALDYPELEGRLDRFPFVVNTVPARILGSGELCCMREDALLLELASPPGGFDRTLAENMGLRVLWAPGLPGKSAPLAAARLMKDCMEAAIAEEED